MKLYIYQPWYALNEPEFNAYQDGKLKVEELTTKIPYATLTKSIDVGTSPVPHLGEFFEDSVWDPDHTQHEVIRVTYAYQEKEYSCCIQLKAYIIPMGPPVSNLEDHVPSHGWEYQYWDK